MRFRTVSRVPIKNCVGCYENRRIKNQARAESGSAAASAADIFRTIGLPLKDAVRFGLQWVAVQSLRYNPVLWLPSIKKPDSVWLPSARGFTNLTSALGDEPCRRSRPKSCRFI